MTTNTTPANPGAVIDIKLSEAAAKQAGQSFSPPLNASLNQWLDALNHGIAPAYSNGTRIAGGSGFSFKEATQNDLTVRISGQPQEKPSDYLPGYMAGSITTNTITFTQKEISTSVVAGNLKYEYYRDVDAIISDGITGTMTSFQHQRVDHSPTSQLGTTSTRLKGALDFVDIQWDEGNISYYTYLSGKLSELSFDAAKQLKSFNVRGDLTVSFSDKWDYSTEPLADNYYQTHIAARGTISSVNAKYYDGSYLRLNSGVPFEINGDISLLNALANAALWAGDDKVNIILPDHIEQSININTGAGNDTVTAKGGDGELGIDTGSGDDLITLLDDQPTLRTGDGIDTLRAGFAQIEMFRYAGLENLVFTGRLAANIDGNELDNQITGGSGSDTINGDAGNDTLNGLAGHDTLNGGFGDDRLFGGTGNDVLNGGEGNDALYGGAGNDTYIVDGGEIVSEVRSLDSSVDSGGIDEVRSLIHYTLNPYIEKLTLLGDAHLNGTGNALANTLTGNSGRNILKGEAGNDLLKGEAGDDRLYGGEGNDTLWGSEGNDILQGDKGADTMWGGSGDDIYYLDHVRDRISEAVSATDGGDAGGEDTVYSTVGFTLTDRLEHLLMLGENHINGTGNANANTIVGNNGDNVINGKGGIDALNGGNGSDIFLIGHPDEHSAAEIADKGFVGIDEVRFVPTSSPAAAPTVTGTLAAAPTLKLFEGDFGIERVVIGTGTGKNAVTSGRIAADIDASEVGNGLTIIGNAGVNALTGTAFDDTLIGNGGKDVLIGGAGKDKFVFNMTPNAKTEVDTIKDFSHGDDQLVFVRSKFANIGPVGDLAESAFYAAEGATKAQDAEDRFIFDTTSGNLYFDRDGSGSSAAVLIGVMTPGTQLSATDFKIVDMI